MKNKSFRIIFKYLFNKGLDKIEENFLLRILGILTIYYFLSFMFVSLKRIFYPFELEFMEGGILMHIIRILGGEKLYVQPSLEFTPFIYPPLYYYFNAVIIGKVDKISFIVPRITSVISTVFTSLAIYFILFKITSNKNLSIISAFFFFSFYKICDYWFDLARVDMLFVLFLSLSFLFLFFERHQSFCIFLSSALLGLSFLTKQIALVFFIIFLFYFLHKGKWKFFLIFFTGFLFSTLSTTIILGEEIEKMVFYLFVLPMSHGISKNQVINFFTLTLFNDLGFFVALLVYLLIFHPYVFKHIYIKNDRLYFLLGGGIISSYISRIHSGGHFNVLLPFYLTFLIFLFVIVDYVLRKLDQKTKKLVLLFLIFQILSLWYNPLHILPSSTDIERGKNFISLLTSFNYSHTFIPSHPYYSYISSESFYSHSMALSDVIRAKNEYSKLLETEICNSLKNKKIDIIIVDSLYFINQKLSNCLLENYKIEKNILYISSEFYTKSGHKTRPSYILLPKLTTSS